MKTIPTVIASSNGERALEVVEFEVADGTKVRVCRRTGVEI